jgi:predicted NACHT family NTPase
MEEILCLEWVGDVLKWYRPAIEEESRNPKDKLLEKNWLDFYIPPELVQKIEQKEKKLNLDDLLTANERKYVIVGEPGIGKTTFSRWATLQIARQRKDLLPVFFSLRSFSGDINSETIEASIQNYRPELSKGVKDNLVQKLKAGKVAIMFDALDEAVEDSEKVLSKINTFYSQKCQGGYCLVTVRPNFHHPMPNFTELAMQRFTPTQVEKYLLLKLGKEEGEKVYKNILEYQLMDFCQTPLILRFVTEIKDKLGKDVKNRADIYRIVIVDHFEREYNKSKPRRGDFTINEKVNALAELAFNMQTDLKIIGEYGGRAISSEEAKTFLQEQAGSKKQEFFDEIERNGLLVEQGNTCYFMHLTIQEYLAAVAIKNKLDRKEFIISEFMDKYVRYKDKTFSGN